MKASSKYESIAAVLALVGSVALVAVYFPILNPNQFGIQFHREGMPAAWYVLGTSVALAILVAAWRCDEKAARLRSEEDDARHVHVGQKKRSAAL